MNEIPYLDFSRKIHDHSAHEKQFIKAQYEITYACNLHCVHCYTDPYNRPDLIRQELSHEAAAQVLDNLYKENILWLCFTGGEIFMRKDFLKIYAYAHQKGFLITLFTNATLISEAIADRLAESVAHLKDNPMVSALCGVALETLAVAILRARHPSVHIRNLLTTHCPRESFVESLAHYMDADLSEVRDILTSFILTADNLEEHTKGGDVTWAPIVQASTDTLILPTYGIDINPFLFLLTDLRYRHEKDWFRVANNREGRWLQEIESLFETPRWQTHSRNLRLREGSKELTDIDFAAYNKTSNELALFQLKWQHPVGMDNRGRRSAGKNLVGESNRWVITVISWLERHGVIELMKRLGFDDSHSPSVHLFVLGRYHVHLSGYDSRDGRAIWSDWAHFRRACAEGTTTATVTQLATMLESAVEQSRAMKGGESMMFPVGNLSVVLNPTQVPADEK